MTDPISVDDDDVVMVGDLQVLQLKEPVVIDDEDDDKINNDITVSAQSISTEDTIVLDDEAPTTTEVETTTKLMDKKLEKAFVNNLENNRLMDKIVTRVTTMENATGMNRIVQKTLLPLYRDTNNRFKESDEFRTMLKKTYKLLVKDPDHKFLHIKTLCEELKSGGLRRKVPFVTLATNLKKNDSEADYTDLTSSSKEMDYNTNNNVKIRPIPEINRKNYITQKKRKKHGKGKKRGPKRKKDIPTRSPIETRSIACVTHTEKTDIIELDDSESESDEDEPINDVILIEESDQKNDNLNTLLKEPLEVPQESNKVLQIGLADCNKENQVIQDMTKESNNENEMIQATLEENSHKNTTVTEISLTKDSDKQNLLMMNQETFPKDFNKRNTLLPPYIEKVYANIYDKEGKLIGRKIVKEFEHERAQAMLEKIPDKGVDKGNNVPYNNAIQVIPYFYYKEPHENRTEQNREHRTEVLQDTLEDNAKNGRSSNNETDYDLLIPQTCLAILPKPHVKPVTIAPKPFILFCEPVTVVREPVTVVREPVTVVREPVTVIREPVTVVREPVTVVREPVTVVREPVNTQQQQDLLTKNAITNLEMRIACLKRGIDKLEEAEVVYESYTGSAYHLCSKYKEDLVKSYKMLCHLTGNSQALVKKRQFRLHVTDGHPPGPAKRLENLLNRSIDSTGEVPFPDFSEVFNCVIAANLADNLNWDKHKIMQEAVALFRQCGQTLRKRRQQREYKDLLSLIPNKEDIDDPAESDPILLAKLEENKRIAKAKEEEILNRYVEMELNPNMYAAEFNSDRDSSDVEFESEQNVPSTGESSRNPLGFVPIAPNNINTSPTIIGSNHSNQGLSSNTNNVPLRNLVVTPTLVTVPGTSNPIFMTHLLPQNVPIPPQNSVIYTNENPPSIRERLIMDDNVSNGDLDMMATMSFPLEIMSDSEETDDAESEEEVKTEELTITETTVGFNNETIKKESDMISTANNQPCNINVSADGFQQNCDSSISTEGASVKIEEHVKTEPVDVQNMFDELGDGFVCQVFDIEDPFLVIEISSDESSDDEEL